MEDVKEGLYNKYIYMDGKKFIGQIVKKDECQYQNISNFKRKTRDQYISLHNSLLKNRKKKLQNKNSTPTDIFINIDKLNPLGKNIEKDFVEININQLVLNSVNAKKYMILKICSKIYVDKSTNFICEDNNNEVVNISIKDCEKYFNTDNFNKLENEILAEGKYIIVIEPNYGIFESDKDEIKINSPNETIILKDKEELNLFLDKNKNISPENYKLLGNLMMKNNYYEKALFYYTEAINLNKNDDKLDIILHSNLSEAYIKYGYYTKCIENANYCFETINTLMKNDENKVKDNFLLQQKTKNLFRKIKALVALRKFKEANEILFIKSENNPYNDILNDFLKMEQVKPFVHIIKNGYQNTLGHFDFRKMYQEEKVNFDLETPYGDYLNPKIEIKFEQGKGIKMVAKEKINLGELLIVEKSIVYSKSIDDKDDEKDDPNVSTDNPKVIVELDLFNKLALKVKKAPLDNEKFYYLTDGRNLNEDLNTRRKYLEEQDKGKRNIEHFKVNQVICLNKYGNGRNILFYNELCVGLWGYPSFLNHDCLPNTNHLSFGDYYVGHSIREIDKGEEITTSYCSAKKFLEERQKIILENWRFKCNCQLCKYQEKKKDLEYNNYIKLFDKNDQVASIDDAKCFEQFLEKNKKKYSCFELANGYSQLEEYYYIKRRDFPNTKRISEIVTKYADGKNFTFQLSNLYKLFLATSASHTNDCFVIFNNLIKYLKKYTPFTEDDIKYLLMNTIGVKYF